MTGSSEIQFLRDANTNSQPLSFSSTTITESFYLDRDKSLLTFRPFDPAESHWSGIQTDPDNALERSLRKLDCTLSRSVFIRSACSQGWFPVSFNDSNGTPRSRSEAIDQRCLGLNPGQSPAAQWAVYLVDRYFRIWDSTQKRRDQLKGFIIQVEN